MLNMNFYDRYVSLVFAYSTNYQNWTVNTNWLHPELPVRDWYGLNCNDDGRIGVLDLAVNNLVGTLPTEIGMLDNLDFVFLSRNELTGKRLVFVVSVVIEFMSDVCIQRCPF